MLWDWWERVAEVAKEGEPFVLATLVKGVGSTPRKPGTKFIIKKNGSFVGTIGGGQLEALVIAEALKLFVTKKPKLIRYELCPRTGQCCGGVVEIFLDLINHQPQLFVFGAGHVGQALTQTMVGTPFEIHVIDPRNEWLDSISQSASKHFMNYDDFCKNSLWKQTPSYIVIMTPSHEQDLELLSFFLEKELTFLGLIGSRSKWARFQQKLIERGFKEKDLNRVTCPIGLDLGGDTPQEIAISIAAQLISLNAKREKLTQKDVI